MTSETMMFQFFGLRSTLFLISFLVLCSGRALAHEYWIDPRQFEVPAGATIEADLRNGQDFRGSAFSYISANFERFTVSWDGGEAPVKGREGDIPALKFQPSADGLHIATYQGRFDRILFNDWERFLFYLDYEGIGFIAERHQERGLPQTGFVEQYKRCAKALFSVGGSGGADRLTGMQAELVAEANPYESGAASIPVRLYWEGKPVPDHQVNVFHDTGEVTLTRHRTDSEGRFVLPLSGGGRFLLNAVMMIEGDSDPATETAEWQSFWASLVFATTGADAMFGRAGGN